MGRREILGHLSVDLIADTDGKLIQIAQYIQNRQNNLRRALDPASVPGRHRVEPAHSSGPSRRGSELAAVAAALSQLVGLFAEDLADKGACAHRAGICLYNSRNILNFIGRDPGSDGTVSRQRG